MQEIRFGPDLPSLDSLSTIPWPAGDTKRVQFYDNFIPITVVESSDLLHHISLLDDGQPMSLDLEWKPDNGSGSNPISVFQFGTSKGVVVALNSELHGSPDLFQVLSDHHFFGKGLTCDRVKLKEMFNTTFDNIDDIETTWLHPLNLPVNFIELTKEMIGLPRAEFKDVQVSKSDWSIRPLSVQQVLYAAFDAFAIYHIHSSIFHHYGPEPPLPVETIKRKKKRSSKTITATADNSRSKPQLTKMYKPKFSGSVQFLDNLSDHLDDLRVPDEDEPLGFVNYGPKWSLLRRWKSDGNVNLFTCLPCNHQFADENELCEHVWMTHWSLLPSVIFVEQTPTYLQLVIDQVEFAANHMTPSEGDKVVCTICNSIYPSFRCFYTHCRLVHRYQPDMSRVFNFPDLLIEVMTKTGHPPPQGFDRFQYWSEFGYLLPALWKHRPVHYTPVCYHESNNLGLICMNQLCYGQLIRGTISCCFCKIGFDDPGELFVHLFHRHSVVIAIRAAEIDLWPLKVRDLPLQMKTFIGEMCYRNVTNALKEGHVYGEKTCEECGISFADKHQRWKHSIENHLILQFTKIVSSKTKPSPNNESPIM